MYQKIIIIIEPGKMNSFSRRMISIDWFGPGAEWLGGFLHPLNVFWLGLGDF